MASMAQQTNETQALIETREAGGVMALAYMNEDEFRAWLEALKLGQERVRRIQRELMLGPTPENPEGEDYGVIPGTKKPTLPGPAQPQARVPQGRAAQATAPDREPGEDNDGFPDEGREAYARHDVEPARPSAPPAGARGGREVMPSCPQGHPPAKVMRSKRGPGFYCHSCGKGFGG